MVFSVFCAADVYGSKWNISVEFPNKNEDVLNYASFVETVESAFEYECRKWAPPDAPTVEFYVEYMTRMEVEMVSEYKAVYYSGERVTEDVLQDLEDGAQIHVHQYGIPETSAVIPPPRNTITLRLLDMFHLRGKDAELVQTLFHRFDTRGSAFFTRETMAEAFPDPAAALPLVTHTFLHADPNSLGYITFGSWLEYLHAKPDRKYDIDNEWHWQVAHVGRDRAAYYSNTTESGNRKRPAFPASPAQPARSRSEVSGSHAKPKRAAQSPSGRHTAKALFQSSRVGFKSLAKTEPQAASQRTPLRHQNHNTIHDKSPVKRTPRGDGSTVGTPARGRPAERHARATPGSPSPPPVPQAMLPRPIAQDIFPTYPSKREALATFPPPRTRVSQLALPRRPITRSSSRGRVR